MKIVTDINKYKEREKKKMLILKTSFRLSVPIFLINFILFFSIVLFRDLRTTGFSSLVSPYDEFLLVIFIVCYLPAFALAWLLFSQPDKRRTKLQLFAAMFVMSMYILGLFSIKFSI